MIDFISWEWLDIVVVVLVLIFDRYLRRLRDNEAGGIQVNLVRTGLVVLTGLLLAHIVAEFGLLG